MTSSDQNEFLKESVNGLAEEGKVISVRLALFAEMMKGKPLGSFHAQGSRRHEGRGRYISGRDLQLLDSASRASAPSESRPGGAESPASGDAAPTSRDR